MATESFSSLPESNPSSADRDSVFFSDVSTTTTTAPPVQDGEVESSTLQVSSCKRISSTPGRSLTAPSTPETSCKLPGGEGGERATLEHVASQPVLSATKSSMKSHSPVLSGSRKANSPKDSPTCSKSRSETFHKLFKCVPEDETPIDYYSCAFIGDILLHGNLYISPNWICFYSKIRARRRLLEIPMEKVQNISREKTALIIPNAIGIQTDEEKFVFGSFLTRDSTYKFLLSNWKKSQDSTDSTKDQSISSPEPMKISVTDRFSPTVLSSPRENNNISNSVIDSPKQTAVVKATNVKSLIETTDSDTSMCHDCGFADRSDSDGNVRSRANQIPGDKSSRLSENNKPHVQFFTQCFPFQKTYKAFRDVAIKLQRIPRTNMLLAICVFMVLFLLMSAVGLTYKLLLLQAKLESRHIWNDVIKFEHREKTYSDIHSFHSRVHLATVQQLHTVLEANLELLSEMNASFKNLHKIYSHRSEEEVEPGGDNCS